MKVRIKIWIGMEVRKEKRRLKRRKEVARSENKN